MMNSRTKDWTFDPTGAVPKNASDFKSSSRYKVPLPRIAPTNCANMYNGTFNRHNKPNLISTTKYRHSSTITITSMP